MLNKNKFINKNNKNKLSKKVNFGEVKILELDAKRIDDFIKFLDKLRQEGKTFDNRVEFDFEDICTLFIMFTNINLKNFSKKDILEILCNPSADIIKCQEYLVNEHFSLVLNEVDKSIDTVSKMSKEESDKLIDDLKAQGEDVSKEEFEKSRIAIQKVQRMEELKKELKKLEDEDFVPLDLNK